MSFSFEFSAPSKRAAQTHLRTLSMPEPVRAFITYALEAMEDRHAVHVKAFGHLYDPARPDYPQSNADISIRLMEFVQEPAPDEPLAHVQV